MHETQPSATQQPLVLPYKTQEAALRVARFLQEQAGRPFYVAPDGAAGGWLVTDRMPLLGEWYDADGHRHG